MQLPCAQVCACSLDPLMVTYRFNQCSHARFHLQGQMQMSALPSRVRVLAWQPQLSKAEGTTLSATTQMTLSFVLLSLARLQASQLVTTAQASRLRGTLPTCK
jgi:hypothetical protein